MIGCCYLIAHQITETMLLYIEADIDYIEIREDVCRSCTFNRCHKKFHDNTGETIAIT